MLAGYSSHSVAGCIVTGGHTHAFKRIVLSVHSANSHAVC